MKQLFTHKNNQKKIISLSLSIIAITTGMGNLQAKTINVEGGPIFNSFFAKIQCERAASKLKGEWNGRFWTNPGSVNGVCQIVVPDPIIAKPTHKPMRRPPIKPSVKLISVDAGRIWNQAHADSVCPKLAKKNNGTWNGKWSEKADGKPSYCQVEVTTKPIIPAPKYKIISVKADRIWSEEHAKQRCAQLAKENHGQWTGKRTVKGNVSSCQVKIAVKPKPHKAVKAHKPRNVREVSAGSIRDQAQANRKCPRIAEQTNGIWTQKWRKTGSNNEAVCEVQFQSLPTQKSVKPPRPTPPPAPMQSGNAREVAAGPIWDQAQASKKCPLIAAQSGSRWTGKWRKLDYGTHQSVCEISSDAVAAVPTKTVVTTRTTYVNLKPAPTQAASNVREIFAGPIWDDNQAQTKCPMIAANNKGTWTGKWRKTGPDHSSLCEVRF